MKKEIKYHIALGSGKMERRREDMRDKEIDIV